MSHLDAWVDNTPVVDCSKVHTLETVEVIKPIEKLTLAQVKQLADSCASRNGLIYLDITYPAVRRLAFPMVYWPSPAQRAAGQNWLRCDVGVQATTDCCRKLAPQTASLRGDVGRDPGRFQICIGQLPDPGREQPLTSCKRPHRAEVFPTALQLNVTHYPSATELSRKGQSMCGELVSDRKDRNRLVFTPAWQDKEHWSGQTLYGWCWLRRNAGLLPPIH